MTKFTVLFATLLLSAASAPAAVIINLGFTVQLAVPQLGDPAGMDGASISMEVRIDQEFYDDQFGFAVATPSQIRMDVSGSSISANNGTFFFDPAFYRVAPNVNGTLWLMLDQNLASPQRFIWGETNAGPSFPVDMTPIFRTPGNAGAVAFPLPGASVIAQDFAGAQLQAMFSRPINGNSFNTAALGVSAVPEPSSTLLVGVGALGLVARRRRRN